MIIPRSPTPLPLEERPIETLTAEEARELLRRQTVCISYLIPPPRLITLTYCLAPQAQIAATKLKSENKSNLKRERRSKTTTNNTPTKPAKISKSADGREYIDLLTSDSDDGSVPVRKRVKKIEVVDLVG
jgi:hypothetical protein